MTYLLSTDGRDEDIVGAFRRYHDYLVSVSDRFPPGAYALATSHWYFDPQDRRCPHDGWLESLTLVGPSSDERQETRHMTLTVRVLGAHHDGYIDLRYPRVFAYTLSVNNGENGHRDWRYDELRLSQRGHLIHEIEWGGRHDTGKWTIEASDLEFRWVPE